VDKKKALDVINKEIERANHDIKTIQFDIKKCPKEKERDLQGT
jgi:hypothetical protein